MTRATNWKAIAVGTALGALSIFGAGTATATVAIPPSQTAPLIATSAIADAPLSSDNAQRPDRSARSSQNQTRGSTQIYTAPNPSVGRGGSVASAYGPFFHQNRGLGGAAAIGAAAGGR